MQISTVTKVYLAAILLALITTCFIAYSAHAAPAVGSKIEYRVIYLLPEPTLQQRPPTNAEVEQLFNKMGNEGWELVEWGKQATAVFKRLK